MGHKKRMQRSKIIADKIDSVIGEKKQASVMEYGCATGLVSFNLRINLKN